MSPREKESGDRKTRRAIVQLLKTEGPLTSSQLAERLGVTAMAVRQHLYSLESEKFVTMEERPAPIGRPAKHWQLTAEADRLFPDAYAELSVSLIAALGDTFGSEGVKRVIESRSARQEQARVRTDEGYMAEVLPGEKGSYLLVERHCPICVAATQCQGFCSSELDLFRKVLGPDVQIEREEHIVSGARRCTYRVTSTSGIERG
jgi:predicted ArsR family transcriptional regulator